MKSNKTSRTNQRPPDLFSQGDHPAREPLAERMRPRTFSEFVGQQQIVGPERLLRRAVEADQLGSIILSGPPGTGKTTIANIIANETKARFATLNAVLDGVKELRDVVEIAEKQFSDEKTILFVDEIHRWNKAQQDALLPHVEVGTITLIGATTENPFFYLIGPLISRSRVFKLEALTRGDIRMILNQAMQDSERGLGKLKLSVTEAAFNHLTDMSAGDARSALNALELAAVTTKPNADGVIVIDENVAAESIQQRVIRYDRDADEHYHTISAFIKSLRGSDPDAALYWMAKMLQAGEDPRFIFRRMLILCSEDIGLADPNAIVVVNSLAEAFERVGLPEGNYFLSHACLYCATAPKSNSAGAIFKAISYMEKTGPAPVPTHLRDSTANAAEARHEGRDSDSSKYKYPHDYPGAWVEQQYLPDGMTDPGWYQPKSIGYERQVFDQYQSRPAPAPNAAESAPEKPKRPAKKTDA